ncbi:MAG: hypothetical protein V2J89_10650, partial [Halieaceae bacterium]|nr:hypothetical protein [Halieaceae bacterium]
MLILAIAVLALCLASCDGWQRSDGELVLPPGDPVAGRAAFVALRCNDCHSVGDVRLRDATATDIHVPLGLAASAPRTRQGLITAIINPGHRVSVPLSRAQLGEEGESPMAPYNDVMTVQELIDLLAFLGPAFG